MAKRGPTPSLIGGTHGTVTFCVARRKTECRRCKENLPKGARCARVSRPGKMGPGRAYCVDCFEEVLDETQRRLDELRAELEHRRSGVSERGGVTGSAASGGSVHGGANDSSAARRLASSNDGGY